MSIPITSKQTSRQQPLIEVPSACSCRGSEGRLSGSSFQLIEVPVRVLSGCLLSSYGDSENPYCSRLTETCASHSRRTSVTRVCFVQRTAVSNCSDRTRNPSSPVGAERSPRRVDHTGRPAHRISPALLLATHHCLPRLSGPQPTRFRPGSVSQSSAGCGSTLSSSDTA